MGKLLKILIIIFIIIIITILVLLLKLTQNTNVENNNLDNNTSIENNNQTISSEDIVNNNVIVQNDNNLKKFEIVKDRKTYIEVEDVVINIITDMKLCNSDSSIKALYHVDGQELIDQKRLEIREMLNDRISVECNIDAIFDSELFKNVIMKETYTIERLYEKDINSNMVTYLIYGEFSKSKTEYIFIVVLDKETKAYEVYLDDYIRNNYDLKDINSIDIKIDKIEKNKNNIINEYKQKEANKKIAQRYFLTLKTKLEQNPEEVYDILYKVYKEEKFKDKEEFYKFAKGIQLSKFEQYKIIDKDNHYEIICKDELDNTIIFKERAVMNYTVILDPYTINLETITEEYNTKDEDKILLNIQQISQMINMKDYTELYKKLNSVFKTNNFKNIESFEEYINKNFYTRSKFEYISSKKYNNENYIVKLQIRNESKKAEKKAITIIMKLGEGKDFEMSFSMDS